MATMKIGDKVRIIGDSTGYSSEQYPFLPDDSIWSEGINGKRIEGHITSVREFENEPPLYMLELDEPLKVGVVPYGQSAFAYEPTEWDDRTDWCAVEADLELVT